MCCIASFKNEVRGKNGDGKSASSTIKKQLVISQESESFAKASCDCQFQLN